ncbi:MAG: phosphate signaling complex protein PhoU [Bacteroidales bacterium]|nr:phosphate signaling complex protein PhoU [Bacteroidales bacterium]
MERHFEQELQKLKSRILKMGNLVADQIHNTMLALQTCDIELAAQVIRNDKIVDKLDVKIDKLCQRIFALQQPVATDLRMIMSSLKMNNDLERMGDHAVGIASRIESISEYPEILKELEMEELIRQTDVIVKDVINILNTWNTTFVRDIFAQASAIEALSQKITDKILEEMSQKREVIVVASALMIILTQMERIAGYSTNMAESVVFIVDGEMIKHAKPGSLFLNPDTEE